MRWDDLRASDNIEDRRGGDGGGGGGSFGGMGGGGGLGIGAMMVLGVIGWALGINPAILIGGAQMMTQRQSAPPAQTRPAQTGSPTDDIGRFVAKILGETEDVWSELLPAQANRPYKAPRLVLFSGSTRSECGAASAAGAHVTCGTSTFYLVDQETEYSDKIIDYVRSALVSLAVYLWAHACVVFCMRFCHTQPFSIDTSGSESA